MEEGRCWESNCGKQSACYAAVGGTLSAATRAVLTGAAAGVGPTFSSS